MKENTSPVNVTIPPPTAASSAVAALAETKGSVPSA